MKFNPRGPVTRSVEFRAAEPTEGGDGRTLDGYAAVFNEPTRIQSWEGDFNESIAPGAFAKTLREKSPIIQFDHGHDARTGSVPIAKLISAKEDKAGLHVQARMFDNPVVEPIRQAIEGGAINGMSFRFEPMRDTWTDAKGADVHPEELKDLLYGGRAADQDRLPLNRVIREVRLHEMGPVVNPAYAGTSVGVRTADDLTEGDREALVECYKRTMVPTERSTPVDGDDDEDDTMTFDHFDSDVPVREDGLPEGYSDEDGDEGRASADPFKPYGDVDYADPGLQADKKKRYPVDTKAHTQSAWSYINKAANAAKYTAANLKKVKAAIKAAAKKFGITISDDSDQGSKKSAPETGAARTEGTPELAQNDAAPTGTSPSTIDKTTRKAATTVKTKEELLARQAEILTSLRSIAEENAERSLDDEKQNEFDGLVAERATVETEIKKIEDRQAMMSSLAATPATRESGFGGQSPAFHKEVDPYDHEAVRTAAAGDEQKYSRLVRDNAHRAIERAKFAAAPRGYDGASSGDVASELLDSVDRPDALARRMVLSGSEVYGRALSKVMVTGSDILCTPEERMALARAQALGTDSAGGFAVPFQLDPTVILTNAGVVNPIRQLARIVQITGKQWEGVTSAGTTAVRGTEASTAPDASFTLAQPTLSTNRVQAFVPFSYELEQAWSALRSEITNVIVDAKEREEDSFITGNGTGTAPFGVIGTTGYTSVATATTATLAASDVYNAYQQLPPRFERNASWLAHKGIYGLIRQFDSAGGAQLWARIGDGQPPRLLDYPDYRSSAMASTTTTGNKLMVFGDFSQYLIVDRIGMNVELIPQVFDASNSNRPTGQRGVYAVWMNNGKRLVDSAFNVLTAA